MLSDALTRRNFVARLGPVVSALGLASLFPSTAMAKKQAAGVQKLDDEGKPAGGTQMITPIVIHNGLAYIAGVGAHDIGPQESWDIGAHTTKVLDNIKKLVVAAGSNMDNVVQLGVFLAKIESYDGMNKVFKTYFPHGGPARTTVAVAALPGNSLVEINCVAALVK